ncbi:GAT domain-containing protein [Diaporthe helianthi]|uniref:GAT domain-containing protein n=1 Tax=Diaporthe helianthi TaxID=158607 RepID=A0A2P5I3R3_DIAHE|nr:GAT domain-containing protein [Diaporthe helianthi]
MKSMKGLSNKMLGSIKKRTESSGDTTSGAAGSDSAVDLQGDSPEAVGARSVKAFCESSSNSGDDVIYLPSIVESAESSPTAAAECARTIRKYLKRDYWTKPSYQYNALMLTRILADNPGPTFTRNLDGKFLDVVKELLRNGKDLPVRNMLMETLDTFEHQKGWDENLGPLIELWNKEKDKAYKASGGQPPPPPRPQNFAMPPQDMHSQNYFARSHSNKRLPDPVELANRLEEARTSAKLLSQLVANTPSTEVLDNDLVKEFADRCLSASRSIQGYMTAENPGPDNETMESLIDVNEELQQALNNEKRARLSARKELGVGDRSENDSPAPEVNGSNRPPVNQPTGSYPVQQGGAFPPPSGGGAYGGESAPPMPRRPLNNGKGKGKGREEPDPSDYVLPPPGPPPGHPSAGNNHYSTAAGPSWSANATPADEGQDPFRDPQPAGYTNNKGQQGGGSSFSNSGAPRLDEPRLADELFHPGFGEQPTRSYLGRQDSAMNKVTMHGAGYGPADQDGDKEVVSSVGGGGVGEYGGSSSSSRPRAVSDLSDDIYNAPTTSDSYGGSSSGKRPVYRY